MIDKKATIFTFLMETSIYYDSALQLRDDLQLTFFLNITNFMLIKNKLFFTYIPSDLLRIEFYCGGVVKSNNINK